MYGEPGTLRTADTADRRVGSAKDAMVGAHLQELTLAVYVVLTTY
jgi:hypothetical protein